MFTKFFTSNFQVQYDPVEYAQSGELALLQQRAQALLTVCEADYSTLCGWFGVTVGAGLGPSNRVVVTLTKAGRGASNSGYSPHNPQMSVNSSLGVSADYVFGLFVAELSEILMSYTGKWNPSNSAGEGLSRVAAELLHPAYARNFVNAWLASDPTQDPTSAQADTEYRKNWVATNFTGGPLRAGGFVRGDDDSYSYGCAMLFLYYLKDQLNYSLPAIVQNGAATLDGTYRLLTHGRTDGFAAFKALLDAHFPPSSPKSPTDDPFPLSPLRSKDMLAQVKGVVGLAGYYAEDDKAQHVILGTNSGAVVELSWGNGRAVREDILTQFETSIESVGGYYAADDNTQHAIVAGGDGDLTELYWKPGQGVHHDVLAHFGSRIVGIAAYYAVDDAAQHVLVGTSDDSVTEVDWRPAKGVQQDVLARFQAIVRGVGGYYAADDDTQHAIVATADGRLTEVYWKPGQGVHQDLLTDLGGEIIGLAAYYAKADEAQHVLVGTADGTLTEVYWRPGQGVHQQMVSRFASSIVGIGGYYAAADDMQHGIVATSDGAITELYWVLS